MGHTALRRCLVNASAFDQISAYEAAAGGLMEISAQKVSNRNLIVSAKNQNFEECHTCVTYVVFVIDLHTALIGLCATQVPCYGISLIVRAFSLPCEDLPLVKLSPYGAPNEILIFYWTAQLQARHV